MARKYVLTTLGCKVNQYESQQIRELLYSFGLRPARTGEIPDLALVNTCAVTSTALAKSRQAIRSIARNGYTSVIVIGCGVAADAESISGIDGVTATLDNSSDVSTELRRLLNPPSAPQSRPIDDAGDAIHQCSGTKRYDLSMNPPGYGSQPGNRTPYPSVANPSHTIVPDPNPVVNSATELSGRITHFAEHQRALLKVQDGCDAGCTYCIVPRVRPKVRYKPIEIAVAEARDLVRAGHKEIVVTGIFLGAYGRGTANRQRFGTSPSLLPTLVDALARVQGLHRLRLSSLEPGDVDETLLDILLRHENCVPHLHLPLQSGSGGILRRMNRQYTLEAYLTTIERVRRALDRPAITTDVIVGFPGETEADFQASLDVVRHVEFSKIHAFPFSPRQRTAAARWKKRFVNPYEIRERINRLAEVERDCSLAYRRRFLGQTQRVLVERTVRGDDATSPSTSVDRCPVPAEPDRGANLRAKSVPHPLSDEGCTNVPRRPLHRGRADRYFQVDFEAESGSPGDVVSVRIDHITATHTYGTFLPANDASESIAGRQRAGQHASTATQARSHGKRQPTRQRLPQGGGTL